jgi:hypothetical protein
METEKPNFVNHVFNFETESKNEFVNIIQYCVLGVIFISLLNKSVQTYLPEIDKDKGTIAIVSEIMIQVVVLFVGVVFIHRIITYIPTMSGVPYADLNVITTILPVLIVMLSVSQLGEKVSILVDRFFQPNATHVKLTPKQPISGSPHAQQTVPPQILPPGLNTSNPMATPEPDFNTMFSGPSNPSQNVQEPFEPMPSNFGGSLF